MASTGPVLCSVLCPVGRGLNKCNHDVPVSLGTLPWPCFKTRRNFLPNSVLSPAPPPPNTHTLGTDSDGITGAAEAGQNVWHEVAHIF